MLRRGRAQPDFPASMFHGRLDDLAIRRIRSQIALVPGSTANQSLVRVGAGDHPLPNVAGHVVDAERAPRKGMRSDLVWPKSFGHTSIGLVVIEVVVAGAVATR